MLADKHITLIWVYGILAVACFILCSGDSSSIILDAKVFNEQKPDFTPTGFKSPFEVRPANTIDTKLELTPTKNKQTPQQCLHGSGGVGRCVKYYECDPKERFGNIKASLQIVSRQPVCGNYLNVCCLYKNILIEDSEAESP